MHLFILLLLRGSIISKCSLKMSEKSGNLIMTGEWQPCILLMHLYGTEAACSSVNHKIEKPSFRLVTITLLVFSVSRCFVYLGLHSPGKVYG